MTLTRANVHQPLSEVYLLRLEGQNAAHQYSIAYQRNGECSVRYFVRGL